MSGSLRFGLVVAVVGLLTAEVVGAQERTYPGAMCVEVQNDKPLDNRQKISRTSDGEIYNLSPSHVLEVVCPVSGLFNDLSGDAANVFVHDRNSKQDICCTTRLNNVGFVLSSPDACSTGTDDRVQTLAMAPPALGFTFTSRYFNCTIPPTDKGEASGIRLYRY
jgi:hypothetical protein